MKRSKYFLFFTLFLFVALLFKAYPVNGAAPTQGLVASFAFDDAAGQTAINSLGGAGANLLNTAGWTAGKIGGAVNLDGNSSLNFGNLSQANFGTGDFGVSFWVKIGSGSHAYLLTKRPGCDTQPFFSFAIGYSGVASMELQQDASSYVPMSGTKQLRDNSWHHMVFVRSGSTAYIYVDGEQDAIKTGLPQMNLSNSANLQIASYPCQSVLFTGAMDDLRIYSRALSLADVQALYELGNQVQSNPSNPTTPNIYTLSVSKNGTGSGTVSGGSISCGSTCSIPVQEGTSVSLSASAQADSTFTGWGGACSGTGACTVSVNNNTGIFATFALNQSQQPPVSNPPTSCPGGRTFYIDWNSGNDASTCPTSKSSPWKRHPYMNGFSGSYSHQAGDQFIFKGGVTWPNAAFQLKVQYGGSSDSNRDYYGVDRSWYAGSSWTRPVFDLQGRKFSANEQIVFDVSNVSNITIDGIEIKNQYYDNAYSWLHCAITARYSSNITVKNAYIHDWIADRSKDENFGGFCGWGESNVVLEYSEIGPGGPSGPGGSMGNGRAGVAARNIDIVRYNKLHGAPNLVLGGALQVYGNELYDLTDSIDSPLDKDAVHENVIETFGPTAIYNNVIHDVATGVNILIGPDGPGKGGSYNIYNNVIYNTGPQPILMDCRTPTSQPITVRVYNNTLEHGSYDTFRNLGSNCSVLDIKNNLSISDASYRPALCYKDYYDCNPATTIIDQNNVTLSQAQASAAGLTRVNKYAPTSQSTAIINKGADLSSVASSLAYAMGLISLNRDVLGATRPSGSWDIGAYEYGGAPSSPGGSGSPSTYTLSVTKSGSGSGTVSAAGINCGTDCSEILNVGTSLSITATPASGSTFAGWTGACSGTASCTVIVNSNTTIGATFNTAAPVTPPLMSFLSFEAEAGLIESPFNSSNGLVYQGTYVSNPSQGGRARYRFNVSSPGNYIVKMKVNAATEGNDSLYVSIDSEPTEPANVWDISPVTSGVAERTVSWRGSGTYDNNQFNPKVFNLTAGEHTLIIRGREAYAYIDSVTIVPYTAGGASGNPTSDTTSPVISGVSTSGITKNSVNITWSTNEAADTQIEYGTTVGYGSLTTIQSTLSTSHVGSIGGLNPSTVYHYRVKSRDASGNLAVSSDHTFTTSAGAAPLDVTAPVISSISLTDTTHNTTNVSWVTNENSDAQVEFGLTTAYGSFTSLQTNLSTTHTVSVINLTPSTVYHYRVKSKDASGNLAVSADKTFTTSITPSTPDLTAPIVSSVLTNNITYNSARITWKTNELSLARIDYGKSTSYGSTASISTLTTSGEITLSNLEPSTTYHYRVVAIDSSGNTKNSANQTFVTISAPAGSTDQNPGGNVGGGGGSGGGGGIYQNPGNNAGGTNAGNNTSGGTNSGGGGLPTTPGTSGSLPQVRTTTILNIRAMPTTAGSIVTKAAQSAVLTVTGTSVYANGYYWLPVKLDNGTSGWAAESYTTKINSSVGNVGTEGVNGVGGAVLPSFANRYQTTAKLNIRTAPSTSGSVTLQTPIYTAVTVTGTGIKANGYTWLPVKLDNGITGWAADAYLSPMQGVTPTIPTSTGVTANIFFNANDVAVTNSNLKVRSLPSTAGSILNIVNLGTQVTIIDGPTKASGYNWYQVKLNNGRIGWVAGEYLKKIK